MPISPSRPLAECLDILGWSRGHLAVLLGVGVRVVQRWSNGQNATPAQVLSWVNDLADFHEKHNLPDGWEER